MAYDVLWTPDARHDVDLIVSYLTETLGTPASAAKLLDGIELLVQTLKTYPDAHEFVRDELLAARGYRKAIIGSYLVLYLVDAQHNEFVITNVVYGSRDYVRFIR